MKKGIIATFLVVVLSVSLVVPVYAFEPVTTVMVGKHYYTSVPNGFGGGSRDTSDPNTYVQVTRERLIGLYLSCVESCSGSYAFYFSYWSNLDQTGIRVTYASNSTSLGFLSTSGGAIYYCTGEISLSDYLSLSSITGYIDQIEGRLARTVDGVTYTVADSSYNTWKTLEDMSGTLTSIAARMLCYTDSGVVNTVAESAYWSFAYQKYTYSRLSDVITAIENIGAASVTLDGVQLNVDSSNINLWNNNAYCCGYRVTVDDVPYETFEIPYDTATAIVARLNTDYVGQGVTLLSRDGTTYTRYVRSATILPDGYIRVKLTNGYNYYLCDNVNVLYVVDMNSNYGSRIESLLTEKMASLENAMTDSKDSILGRLDVIIENLEGIRANSEITVVQQIQQNGDDVNTGLDSVGQILTLVRDFFNPGVETDWGGARDYAMNWGSDVE